jgi:hypothetical protein
MFPPEVDGEQVLRGEISAALTHGVGGAEGWRVRKNGEHIWAIGKTKPLMDGGGTPAGVVKILRDRTKERKVAETLREQTRALEILNSAGGTLARETELEVIVQAVTDAGVALSGAEFGAFFTMSPIRLARATCSTAFRRPSRSICKISDASQHGGLCADLLVKALFDRTTSHRIRVTARTRRAKGMPEVHLPVRSYLAVPVVSRSGEVIGGLFFGHSSQRDFYTAIGTRIGRIGR